MKNVIETIQRLWDLCAGKRIILYVVGSAVNSLLTVINFFLLGCLIDSLVYGGKALMLFCCLVANAGINWLLEYSLRRMIVTLARDSELKLQCRMLAALHTMTPNGADNYRNGELGIKFFRDAGNIGQFLLHILPQFLKLFFSFLFAVVMVLHQKPIIGLLYLLILPIMFAGIAFYAKKLTAAAHTIRSVYDHSINGIFEFMHYFSYLKSMNAEEPCFAASNVKFQRFRKVNTINDQTITALDFFNRFLLLCGEYSILAIAGFMAYRKMIPIGDVVMFQALFLAVLNAFSGLFQLLPNWKNTQESIVSVDELLQNSTIEDIECNPPIPSALADIIVRRLSFRYPNAAEPIFNDFSCEIKAGSIVALTGINGSGKTTLLKLLTGYLRPDTGSVEIAGKNLQAWQIRSFRKKIACVFQDSLLISGTLRDNITLKNPIYTDSNVAEALRLSGADQLIARLPEGLQHKIGFSGSVLSGGERQKLAIARALIRKPQILIFDEVTNHLDCDSRLRIRDLLLSFRGKVTVFMVSHDPELVQLCDQEIKLQENCNVQVLAKEKKSFFP